MATAVAIAPPPATERRRDIDERYASLGAIGDAELLGLPPGATPAQVRAAFVAMARRFHPDSAAPGEDDLSPRLKAIFIRVTEAYRNLSRRGGLVRPSFDPAADERRRRVDQALSKADELIGRRQVDEAVSVLHEVLTQADEPRRRRVRLLLARAYAPDPRRRRYAVTILRELVAQNPRDPAALAALGELYQREGLLSRAEPMFVRALAADPGLAEARRGLRSVRAALENARPPSRAKQSPRRGLIFRLFLVAR